MSFNLGLRRGNERARRDANLARHDLVAESQTARHAGVAPRSLREVVFQLAHGFEPLDPVYHDGTEWVLADADDLGLETAAVGVVEWADTNTFSVVFGGRIHGTFEEVGLYYVAAGGGITQEAPDNKQPILFATSTGSALVLPWGPTATDQPPAALVIEVAQAAHGFAAFDGIYLSGGTWAKATDANTEDVGLVVAVPTANTFWVCVWGVVCVESAWSPGQTLYLTSTPGQLSTTPTEKKRAVVYAVSATVLLVHGPTRDRNLGVSTDMLQDGAVTEEKIEDGAVTEDKLGDGAVTTDKLDDEAVTEGKIGAAAVTEAKIGTGAVTATKIGAGAVIEAKIGAGAVTEAKIGAAAVTEAKIGAGAVTTAKIGDGQVTSAKMDDKLTAGSAGSASVVPVIQWDAKGRFLSVSTATITPAAIGAVDTATFTGHTHTTGGDVSGTLGAVSVDKLKGKAVPNGGADWAVMRYDLATTSWVATQLLGAVGRLLSHDGTVPTQVTAGSDGMILRARAGLVPEFTNQIDLGTNAAGGGRFRIYFAPGKYFEVDSSGNIDFFHSATARVQIDTAGKVTVTFPNSNKVEIASGDFGALSSKTVKIRAIPMCEGGVSGNRLFLCSDFY